MSAEEKAVREQIATKWASQITSNKMRGLFKLLMWDLETDRMCYSGHFVDDIILKNEIPEWLDEKTTWYHRPRS